jgi:cold-inducible RNA-binding protein
MSTRLFVGNLSYQSKDDDLRQFFAAVANVKSVLVVFDRATGKSKGFAFVEMATPEDAQKAIAELNGKSLQNRTLRIDFARPRQQHAANAEAGPKVQPGA